MIGKEKEKQRKLRNAADNMLRKEGESEDEDDEEKKIVYGMDSSVCTWAGTKDSH